MKIIMFSSDMNLFRAESAVSERMLSYAESVNSIDIILLSGGHKKSGAFSLGAKVSVHPTNSLFKIFAPVTAFFIGAKLVFKKKYDQDKTLITSQDPFEIGLAAYLLHAFTRIPLEVQLHTDVLSPFFVSHNVRNRLRAYIARCLIPKADRVRVVSSKIKEGLVQVLGVPEEKIEVRPVPVVATVHSGGEMFSLKDKYPGFSKYVLMVSRLTSEKNYFFALDVFRMLPETAVLIIVGDGPLKKDIDLKVKEYGIEKRVMFEGWQDNLFSYYRSADALFHAALYEGYGVVFKEAEHAGLPIVSSDVGVAREVANSVVYPVNDREAAISALKKVLS